MSDKLRLLFKTALFILYFVLGITVVIPLIFSFYIYAVIFGKRCEKTEKCLKNEDFPQLDVHSVKFNSKKNCLDASFYYNNEVGAEYKALLVFCHGIGCGRENYLNRIDYFTKKGYLVFGYDLTGCVNSGGHNIKGLPQAIIDLRSALQYLQGVEEIASLPVVLYGHSWSAYACASLMNEGDYGVKAIVTCSGFDSSRYIASEFMDRDYRFFKYVLGFYFRIVEYFKFGKIAKYSAMDGINKFNKPIIVAHSQDDPSIPFSSSIYSKKDNCTNPWAQFLCFEDRGHTLSRPVEDEKIIAEKFKSDKSFRNIKKNESFFKYHVDKHYNNADTKYIYSLDDKFMDSIDKFYVLSLGL